MAQFKAPSFQESIANMFARFFSRIFKGNNTNPVPALLYGKVVAAARIEILFEEYKIPDTVMGRYDMLALHVFLLTHRLKNIQLQYQQIDAKKSRLAASLSQEIFDLFIEDIERAIREIGLGDSTVTKRKKRMVHSFYSLVEELDEKLRGGEIAAMRPALAARYFSELEPAQSEPAAEKLSIYIADAANSLADHSLQQMVTAQLNWFDPVASAQMEQENGR